MGWLVQRVWAFSAHGYSLSAASSLVNSSLPWRDLEAQRAAGALLSLSGWSVQGGQASGKGTCVCTRVCVHTCVCAHVCVCTGAQGMLGAGTISFLLFRRSFGNQSAEMKV